MNALAQAIHQEITPIAKVSIGVEGHFDITVKHGDGSETVYPRFKNKIVNQGLDALGGSFPTNYGTNAQGGIVVGTGNTPPSATDTALQTPLTGAFSTNAGTIVPSSMATAPYASSNMIPYTFTVGQVVGNIAEVGMLLTRTSGTKAATDAVFSRALIQVGGSPGTITLVSTDQLIVNYTLTYTYASDTTGSIIVTTDGVPSAANNFTVRPISLTDSGSFFVKNPFAPFAIVNNSGTLECYSATNTALVAANGATLTSDKFCSSVSAGTYTAGSFTRTFNAHWNSATATSRVMYWVMFPCMVFQMLFTTAFGPTAAQTMDFGMQLTWAAT